MIKPEEPIPAPRESRFTRGYDEKGKLILTQYGRIEDMDDQFNIEFWQSQDSTARFRAVEELVDYFLKRRGRENERRLQRYVGYLQRIRER